MISSEGNAIADTDEDRLRKRKREKLDIDSCFEKIGSKGRKTFDAAFAINIQMLSNFIKTVMMFYRYVQALEEK